MSLVSKEFIELTDRCIEKIKEIGMSFGNGNVLIAKVPPPKRKGSIILVDDDLEKKKKNFARVLAIPSNLDPEGGDMDIKPGDYVFFTYVAESPLYLDDMSTLLGINLPREMLFYTSDSEIVNIISPAVVHTHLFNESV